MWPGLTTTTSAADAVVAVKSNAAIPAANAEMVLRCILVIPLCLKDFFKDANSRSGVVRAGLKRATGQEHVADNFVADDAGLESNFAKQAEPEGTGEEAVVLALVHDADVTVLVSDENSEVDEDCVVFWIRVRSPLHEAHIAFATVIVRGNEGLA
jgi:hypothetical protein